MLIELESIKDLLVEQDDIPILQEVIVSQSALTFEESSEEENSSAEEIQEVFLLEVEATPEDIDLALNPASANLNSEKQEQEIKEYKTEQQQDFFGLSVFGDISTPSATQYTDIKASQISDSMKTSASSAIKSASLETTQAKSTGQNPFLPEHIRARLHGNNPPPTFTLENTYKNKKTTPFTRSSNSYTHSSSTKKINSHQQQLIDEVINSLLPEIERELRGRLEAMSKTALEELLAAQK